MHIYSCECKSGGREERAGKTRRAGKTGRAGQGRAGQVNTGKEQDTYREKKGQEGQDGRPYDDVRFVGPDGFFRVHFENREVLRRKAGRKAHPQQGRNIKTTTGYSQY